MILGANDVEFVACQRHSLRITERSILGRALWSNACEGSYVALHLRLGLGHRTRLTKCGPQCLQAKRNVRIGLVTMAEIFTSDGSSIRVCMSRSMIH